MKGMKNEIILISNTIEIYAVAIYGATWATYNPKLKK